MRGVPHACTHPLVNTIPHVPVRRGPCEKKGGGKKDTNTVEIKRTANNCGD